MKPGPSPRSVYSTMCIEKQLGQVRSGQTDFSPNWVITTLSKKVWLRNWLCLLVDRERMDGRGPGKREGSDARAGDYYWTTERHCQLPRWGPTKVAWWKWVQIHVLLLNSRAGKIALASKLYNKTAKGFCHSQSTWALSSLLREVAAGCLGQSVVHLGEKLVLVLAVVFREE